MTPIITRKSDPGLILSHPHILTWRKKTLKLGEFNCSSAVKHGFFTTHDLLAV